MSAHILVADDQSISRTIIDAHSGRLWPQLTATRAMFQFTSQPMTGNQHD